MKNGIYHYTECGLDTVFLVNGYSYNKTSGGKTVTIHDVDGLHRVIGLALVSQRERLSGKELRYLRTELLLSQAMLAKILGVRELTIGRWEKGQTEIPVSAEAIVRMLFAESVGEKKGRVKDLLERIADLEDEIDRCKSARHTRLTLDESKGRWTSQAA
ncbi:MAG: helix-turn-helix domain-containing protein [Methyloceanibacter sp.]|uniref:helix-turn-helix domain-containing protein n=1 Tax=Methyloceanibacter sp. TaxID=1965321 RepID=UPI003D6D9FD0